MQETFEQWLERTKPVFAGSDVDMNRDAKRLTGQILDIYNLMKDGEWRTLGGIEAATGHGQASVSAQLRNLRKRDFGLHTIEKRHLGRGLYEYCLIVDKVSRET